jgi:hypothetical protein
VSVLRRQPAHATSQVCIAFANLRGGTNWYYMYRARHVACDSPGKLSTLQYSRREKGVVLLHDACPVEASMPRFFRSFRGRVGTPIDDRGRRPCRLRRSGNEIALVPLAGIEPALLAELDFESSASTNSATGAFRGACRRRGPRSRRNIAGAPCRSTRRQQIDRGRRAVASDRRAKSSTQVLA